MFAVSAIFLLALELVSGVRPDVAELLVAALGSMQGVTRTTLPFLYLFVGVVMWISLRNPTNRALSVFVTGLALFVMISRLAERL
jgi:integral membrane sensor domain MASE1